MSQPQRSLASLAPLFLVIIIDTMGIGLVFPVLSAVFMNTSNSSLVLQSSLEMREFLYGLTLALYCFGMFFGAPFFGDLSDQMGRKRVIMLCLLGVGFGYAISGIGIATGSVSLLLLGRALGGFVAGSQSIAQAAIIDVSAPEQKAANLGLITFAACIGFVIGPVIGGVFSDAQYARWFGMTTPFLVATALAIGNAFLLMTLFKETYAPREKKTLNLHKGVAIFISAFKHPGVRILSVVFLFSQLVWGIYFNHISLYLVHTLEFSAERIGVFMSFIGLIFALTLTVIIRLLVKMIALEMIVLNGFIASAIGILIAMFIPGEVVQWIAIIPTVIGVGMCYTSLLTLFSNAVDADSQGWVMGITGAVAAVAWGLGALLTGILAYWFIILPFAIAFMFAVLGIVAILQYQRSVAD